jgi:hypothetical protein
MRSTFPTFLGLSLVFAAGGAAAQSPPPPTAEERVKTAEELKRESVQGAATAPLRDFNVMRAKIPPVLLQAMADPYARPPKGYNCRALIALVRPLDDALGPDLDRVVAEDQDVMERSRETALGAAADLASEAIPFRGWIRKLTGAERHDRLVRDAIFSGGVRRAYLKGLGEAKGCNPPATPSHEKAGTPPPDLSRRFTPRFPTRQPDPPRSGAPQSPAGTAPSAPRR